MSFTPQQPFSYTPTSTVGALFIDATQPWLTLPLCWLLDSAGSMFDQVYDIAADQGFDGDAGFVPGYGSLFDPNLCPDSDLGYLAQFVGARIPPGTSPDVARQIIISEPGQKRGSPGSIIAAAQRFLTGTQSCFLLERTALSGASDPNSFVLVVRPEELTSAAQLTDAVNAVKPAGLIWSLTQSDGWVWSSAAHVWSADSFSWASTSSTQP